MTLAAVSQGAIYENPLFVWAIALIVGFPALLVLLTEALVRLQRFGHPAEELVRSLRNLLLPTVAALVLLSKVLSDSGGSHILRVTQTLLWISLIHVGLTTLNVVLFGSTSESTWRGRVPKLLRDISRSLLILVGSGIVLSTVWQADLKGFLAALGLGSLVIGWALQDTLSNIIAGFVLLFERSFTAGDWIRAGETVGRVSEVTWRSVQLVTRANEQIVLPNAALAKAGLINFSRPTATHHEFVRISFAAQAPPNDVRDLLRQAVLDLDETDKSVPVAVLILSMDRDAVQYLVRIPVLDYFAAPRVVDAFLSQVWYAAQRAGLSLAGPGRQIALGGSERPSPSVEERRRQLARFAVLGSLSPDLLELLATEARSVRYGRGERILRPGQALTGMWLLLRGTVALRHVRDGKEEEPTQTLAAGEIFGEEALVGASSGTQSVIATSDCELLLLPDVALQLLVQRAPASAREISHVGRQRFRELRDAPPG